MAYANVGAQDPELKNSPVAGDDEEPDAAPLFDEASAAAVCYFNGEAFEPGTVVRSGTELLRCEFGVWIPVGGSDPDNP
jgi:hypothetical protein